MKKYKSSVQRLNESRKTYRSILSERITDGKEGSPSISPANGSDIEGISKPRPESAASILCPTCVDIDYCECNDWDTTSAAAGTCTGQVTGTILKPTYMNTGAVPQVGDVFQLANGSTDRYIMTATPNMDPGTTGIHVNQSVGVTCGGGTTCDFPTMSAACAITADLTNQFVNTPTQFLSNMATWYANPPGPNDGCNFLGVVRQKHLGHLSTGIAINGNNPNGVQMGPAWISQKQSKVAYLDCILADLNAQGCCAGTGTGGNSNNTQLPKPSPIKPSRGLESGPLTVNPQDWEDPDLNWEDPDLPVHPPVAPPNPHDNFDALEESRVIKLKESDLTKMVKRIISEQSSACVIHQAAQATTNPTNPQLGDAGITQGFVNNMVGKPSQFYNTKAVAFMNKIQELNNGMSPLMCTGQNPFWQAKLFNKKVYAENCLANPGTC